MRHLVLREAGVIRERFPARFASVRLLVPFRTARFAFYVVRFGEVVVYFNLHFVCWYPRLGLFPIVRFGFYFRLRPGPIVFVAETYLYFHFDDFFGGISTSAARIDDF